MKIANQPPVYRDAKRMVLLAEQAVENFSRYRKYTIGTDLREQCMKVLRLVHRACRDKKQLTKHLKNTLLALDDVKLTLQVAKDLQAFQSFAVFEQIAELVFSISKQCGGWLRSIGRTEPNSSSEHSMNEPVQGVPQ